MFKKFSLLVLTLLLSTQVALGTTSTFFPAAGANSPVDGYVERSVSSETFVTIRGGAGTEAFPTSAKSGIARLSASSTTDEYNDIRRGIFLFGTSSIGSDIVSSATFSIFGGSSKLSALGSPDIHVVASTPASDDDLVPADYGALGTTSFGSISHASYSTSAYNDFTLNAGGIAAVDTGGISKYGTRDEWDRSGTFGGTWASGSTTRVQAFFADQTGTANDPKLVVEHAEAVSTGFLFFLQ